MNEVTATKQMSGWIKFIGFSLVASFVSNIFTLFATNLPAISDGTWTKLIFQSSELYHPIYFPTLLLDLVSNIFIVFSLGLALTLYFKRDKEFPKIFCYVLLFNLAALILSTICISAYPNPVEDVLKTQEKAISRSIIFCLIWIPYTFKSVSVKETFTNGPFLSKFINLHKTFTSAFFIIFVMFSWGISNKKALVSAKSTDSYAIPDIKKLDSKDIAKIALENLVVIEPRDRSGKKIGVASGFFIFSDIIVTNAHVIDKAHTASIRRPNESTSDFASEIVAIDHSTDIALIRAKSLKAPAPLTLGNFQEIPVGSTVYTAGNPQGLEGTFSDGLLSNRLRNNGVEIIQISAPISQGSSGGPVLDENGHVIGVTTAVFKKGQNLNLAIPSVYISRLIMKTPSYYPLNTNSDLSENKSVTSLFPQVCDHLIDIALPEQHFSELSPKDIQNQEIAKICETSMPDCKKIWYNRTTEAAIFVGSRSLDADSLAGLSKNEFDNLMMKLIERSKEGYRSSNPETTFKVSQRDLKSHMLRIDLDAKYKTDGEYMTDHRSYYFILPYCRFEILYTSSNKNEILDSRIFEVINENFRKSLPGINAEEAIFKFPQ